MTIIEAKKFLDKFPRDRVSAPNGVTYNFEEFNEHGLWNETDIMGEWKHIGITFSRDVFSQEEGGKEIGTIRTHLLDKFIGEYCKITVEVLNDPRTD